MKENAQLEPDGANVKYRPDHGPLTAWYICGVRFSANNNFDAYPIFVIQLPSLNSFKLE